MWRISVVAVLLAAWQAPASASHLSEAEVIAMEEKCQELRKEKLGPEKEGYRLACIEAGEVDEATCAEQAAQYGEIKTGGVRMLGKYYDLPECVEAYRARKHFRVNPGR